MSLGGRGGLVTSALGESCCDVFCSVGNCPPAS